MPGLRQIEDDYVYRQEDLVLRNVVEKHGFRSGNVEDMFHFHQVMHKVSPWARRLSTVSIKVEWSEEEQIRASMMQIKGIVKYLQPSPALVIEVENHLRKLLSLGAISQSEFRQWVLETEPSWYRWIRPWRVKALDAGDAMRAWVRTVLHRLRRV